MPEVEAGSARHAYFPKRPAESSVSTVTRVPRIVPIARPVVLPAADGTVVVRYAVRVAANPAAADGGADHASRCAIAVVAADQVRARGVLLRPQAGQG